MRRNFHQVSEPKVVIIPMIDIMLFLLVFFMMATMYMVQTNAIQVNLPAAATAKQEMKPNIISVTVTEKGDVLFDKDSAPTQNLGEAVQNALAADPDVIFVIRGDKKVAYEYVAGVLDVLKKCGTKHVSIATELKGGK